MIEEFKLSQLPPYFIVIEELGILDIPLFYYDRRIKLSQQLPYFIMTEELSYLDTPLFYCDRRVKFSGYPLILLW